MEIVVKRIAKKKTYTIGHLYILSDKDVKRTWRSGVKIGDKRIFEHSFDMAKLDKEHYFCDTLEPTWRNLLGVELKRKRRMDGTAGYRARKPARYRVIRRYRRVRILLLSRNRQGLRSGFRWCRVFLILRASASMPVIIPMIRRAAFW